MLILVLLILINVLIVIIFRLYPKFGVRNIKAIILNYFVCFSMGSLILGHSAIQWSVINEKWLPFAIILSCLFILIFNIVALGVQKIGLIITAIFQKISLIFPVILGIFFFSEPSSLYKWLGVLCGIMAIIMINLPDKNDKEYYTLIKEFWYLPLLIMVGNGTIESVLFYVDEKEIVPQADIGFVSVVFLFSGIIGIIYALIKRDLKFSKRDLIGGFALGIPNFFSIYLILYCLNNGWDGSVLFPISNVGVLALTAITGVLIFHESLNKYNILGIIFAIITVILVSL